jgi:hypothetical protein
MSISLVGSDDPGDVVVEDSSADEDDDEDLICWARSGF